MGVISRNGAVFVVEGGILKKYIDQWGFTDIVIPDGVTRIGGNAFSRCVYLKSVMLPDTVTSIGDFSFGKCENLEMIFIPDSVETIGSSTFWGCKRLTSVTIPYHLTDIGKGAFEGCRSLTSVEIAGKPVALPADQHDTKNAIIAGLFRASHDKADMSPCVSQNFDEFFAYLLKTGDIETVRKVCGNGTLLTKDNIDKQIQAAYDAGQHEIQTMLLNYKNEHFGFDDPLKNFKL